MLQSTIYRFLSDTEIIGLEKEYLLYKESSLWRPHHDPLGTVPIYHNSFKSIGALKDGESLWINGVSDNLNVIFQRFDNFPHLTSLFSQLSFNSTVGRSYLHRLNPNKKVHKHQDFGKYFNKVKNRFQIFLDIPEDVTIFFDNKIQDINELKYSILNFNYRNLHYYENHSNSDFVFCVVDILHTDINN